MKSSYYPHLVRISLFAVCPVAILLMALRPDAVATTTGGVFSIPAEADSLVDTLVPFPYQGLNVALAVGHDPSFGSTARSYIRFPLDEISPVARVRSARIDLRATLAVQTTSILVHRSENDTWLENMINFANQPGYAGSSLGSATVSGA